ncbi:hypothetical protein P3X46_016350 [Hevea brasiliensis]|uniref:Protein kinase domain-containing protein n=1 Tax=Hevea brasiliensis TaxID=3981 RepID=A0ABQ9M116_HEVBR|nr:hypothetical protein P3X46_016350 [Hevea brasiliensis]
MINLSSLKPTLFLFFLFSLFLHLATASNAPYQPSDLILLDCGSSENTTVDRRQWTGDLESKFGPLEPSYKKSVYSTALIQGDSQVPYTTARLSGSPFTYTFPVTAGQKFVRLYFYPARYQGFDRSKDFFDVKAGPYTLLRNFSATFYARGWNTSTFIKEYCINVEKDQQLNITFAPSVGSSNGSYAFINGIEIVSMPTNLYYTPPAGLGLNYVGQKWRFYLRNDTALEKMYRFNVGGGAILPVKDNGMFRLWEDDIHFLAWAGVVYRELNFSPNYSKISRYTAPDDIYRTARSLGPKKTYNLLRNLTWVVSVDQGFMYLIRLHFCEFLEHVITRVNDRRFSIFIDNQTAQLDFDVFESSGGIRIPIYNDYMIVVGSKEETDDYYLYISLHPNASYYDDVILNGMEVFKLNDSEGSLAFPNYVPPAPAPEPASPQLWLPTKKSSNKKTLLIAVGGSVMGLLTILSLFWYIYIRQQRKRKHNGSYHKSLSCWRWLNPSTGLSSRTKASSLPKELCRHFSLVDIKAATNNFHESLVIGVGGFGNVYRGDLDDGAMVVAVKRLNPESSQGAQEFKTEIEMLSQLRDTVCPQVHVSQ